jgi:hypothetical protein
MIRTVRTGLILAAALAGASSLAGVAIAQDSRDDRYFMLRDPFRPNRGPLMVPRDFPLPGGLPPPAAEPRVEQPGGVVYTSSAEADAQRLTPASEYVLVLGDTLADQLALGLADAFAADRPEVAVIKRTRDSTGFVRQDVFNWVEQGPMMAGAEKATVIVVILGMNDRQVLRDETGAHEPRSERWREIYGKRVEDFLTRLKEKNVPIFMVGLPSMRLPQLSADMPYINEIFRERAQKVGATYIDVWDGFVNERGDFAFMGPALDGQMRRLRMNDGVHFTRIGARKLAHFVERDLVRLFGSRSTPLPQPQDLTPDPGPGPRPLAGPVIPLTTPTGQSAVLAGSGPRTVPMDSYAIRTLVEGLPAEPVQGRADDFRWEQPSASVPQPAPPAAAARPAAPAEQVAAPGSGIAR